LRFSHARGAPPAFLDVNLLHDHFSQFGRACPSLIRPVTVCRKQILQKSCVDVSVSIVAGLAHRPAVVALRGIQQVFVLTEVLPLPFVNTTGDSQRFRIAVVFLVVEASEPLLQNLQRPAMTDRGAIPDPCW
jgi:hypothetical protein